jgi:hypothetical protein
MFYALLQNRWDIREEHMNAIKSCVDFVELEDACAIHVRHDKLVPKRSRALLSKLWSSSKVLTSPAALFDMILKAHTGSMYCRPEAARHGYALPIQPDISLGCRQLDILS